MDGFCPEDSQQTPRDYFCTKSAYCNFKGHMIDCTFWCVTLGLNKSLARLYGQRRSAVSRSASYSGDVKRRLLSLPLKMGTPPQTTRTVLVFRARWQPKYPLQVNKYTVISCFKDRRCVYQVIKWIARLFPERSGDQKQTLHFHKGLVIFACVANQQTCN